MVESSDFFPFFFTKIFCSSKVLDDLWAAAMTQTFNFVLLEIIIFYLLGCLFLDIKKLSFILPKIRQLFILEENQLTMVEKTKGKNLIFHTKLAFLRGFLGTKTLENHLILLRVNQHVQGEHKLNWSFDSKICTNFKIAAFPSHCFIFYLVKVTTRLKTLQSQLPE